jgi:hypothetical protein
MGLCFDFGSVLREDWKSGLTTACGCSFFFYTKEKRTKKKKCGYVYLLRQDCA